MGTSCSIPTYWLQAACGQHDDERDGCDDDQAFQVLLLLLYEQLPETGVVDPSVCAGVPTPQVVID